MLIFICSLFSIASPIVGKYLSPPEYLINNEVTDFDVCTTQGCLQAAKTLKGNMNLSIDPCEDFFEFSCGGWIKKHAVPTTDSHWSQFSEVDKKLTTQMRGILESEVEDSDLHPVKSAKMFYKACLDTDKIESRGLQPLIKVINSFGGWPMAMKNWRSKNFNLQEVMADTRMFPIPIISVTVSKDSKNSTQRVIYIDQPILGIMRSILLDQTTYKEHIKAYKHMIEEIALLVAKSTSQRVSHEILKAQVEEIIDFETQIAKLSSPNEMRRNSFRIYNPMTVRELQKWTDTSAPNQINWLEFLETIFEPAKIHVTWKERVVVRELDYLFKVVKLLEKTPKRVLSNYLNWKLVRRYSGDLNGKMRKLAFIFDQAMNGVTQDQERWKECIHSTSMSLSMAVGYSYVMKYFDLSAKNVAKEMSENIKRAFNEELSKLDWMDPETRQLAQSKVDTMLQLIGYPDWFNNQTAMDKLYSNVDITDNHFDNVMGTRRYTTLAALKKLKNHVNRNEWPTSPSVVNAYNFGQSNAIVFPAGILQPPFFSHDRIEALNYGGIGVVIGHEIIHGFDDDGRQFDKLGNLVQWWTDTTLNTYLTKADCFVKQYSGYRIPELDDILFTKAKVNGAMTQGENIADNGGLHIALLAYRKHVEEHGEEPRLAGLEQFSPEQLFFIAFATNWCESTTKESLLQLVLDDPHSPHKFRVFGTLANSPDFTRAFKCNAETQHNIYPICQLW